MGIHSLDRIACYAATVSVLARCRFATPVSKIYPYSMIQLANNADYSLPAAPFVVSA